ncbi:MAG: phosphoadenylyl-sulfate reductase [Pseudomonadota bacterium]
MLQPSPFVLSRLNERFGTAPAETVLRGVMDRFEGKIALVSSFGAEAAVLLHMVSMMDRNLPVLFLNTELLFPQTLLYQQALAERLRLSDIRIIVPNEATDPDRKLHFRDTQACCALRKIEPLNAALNGFDAFLTGRKRFQTQARKDLELFEADQSDRLRINPLANWTTKQVTNYFAVFDLPRHPLTADGYPSIGCAPCTTRVTKDEDARAGRWRSEEREECGIHFNENGTIIRRAG